MSAGQSVQMSAAVDDYSVGVPLLLTVPEAAQLLRVGRNRAYDLARRGEIPSIRLGRIIRIPRDLLLAWIDDKSRGGEAAEGLTAVVDFPPSGRSQRH